MNIAYHIHDEPTGSRSNALILNPFWALLAMMLAGAWLGALLFALNAALLRGPTWRREILLVLLLLLGAPLIFIAIRFADLQQWLPQALVGYALLLIVAWKLVIAYSLFFLQENTFALYEYFGGNAAEQRRGSLGMVALVVGMVVKSRVVVAMETPLWRVMVN